MTTLQVKDTVKNPFDYQEDYEVKIAHPINGYSIIYRRIFYEGGYMKRVVIGFTADERELASKSLVVSQELDTIKKSVWYKFGRFFGTFN